MIALDELWIQHNRGGADHRAKSNGANVTVVGSDASDEALMEAFTQGDEQAFRVLFDRYTQSVSRLILRLTGSRALAMDVMQTTFLSVVRGRGRYTRCGKFKPCVYAIARNSMRGAFRRTKHEVLTGDGNVPELMFEPFTTDPAMARHVRRALESLNDAQREAVILHHIEGLSFSEIASMLDTTEAAVKLRASRGYHELRARLRDAYGAP